MRIRAAASAIALVLPLVACSAEKPGVVTVSDTSTAERPVSVTATEGSVPSTPSAADPTAPDGAKAPRELPPVKPRVVKHGPRGAKRVALTFDLCSTEDDAGGYDRKIVRVLRKEDVRATFFMGGLWAKAHAKQAGDLGGDELFEIGNHSSSHPDMSKASRSKNTREIETSQKAIAAVAGVTPVLFRFPGGLYDAEALKVVAEHGLLGVEWDVNPGDPDPNISADRLAEWVPENVRPGSIVLMHANGRGVHTAEALPRIIEKLKDDGYEFVTVSELLED